MTGGHSNDTGTVTDFLQLAGQYRGFAHARRTQPASPWTHTAALRGGTLHL